MPRALLAFACASIFAVAADARAAYQIDQHSGTSDTTLAGPSLAQSFFPFPLGRGFGSISNGNFYLATATTSQRAFRIDLYLGDQFLATTTTTVGAGSAVLTFQFGSTFELGITTSTLVVTSVDGSTFGLLADDRNPYAGGVAYQATSGGTLAPVPSTDLKFDEGILTGSLPEPSSFVLLGIGAAAIAPLRRLARRPA